MLLMKVSKRSYVRLILVLFVLTAFKEMPAAEGAVVFEDDFETCDFSKWNNAIDPSEGEITRLLTHSGACAFRHGGDNVKAGDLAHTIPGGDEFWMTGWVFFPNDFVLPAPGGGIHIWRLANKSLSLQLDFVVPDRQANIKINHFPGRTDGQTVQKGTSLNPIAGDRKGRWQCWEVHSRLNKPGQSDGLVEFYADGELIAKITGNFRGNSSGSYTEALFSSNIGGNAALWPRQNWRYLDDVVLSTGRVGCMPDVLDKVPPSPPTGVRINSQ